ncbi:TadE/TadG family type IV pilus assembly protein [Streptomyces bohaiensis]|uniref:TadE/TadG family type IV pilus assembly protein n=1 Tax=Streptomyces bohaiensis TaxID=1431344 RepID=UPI003B772BEA
MRPTRPRPRQDRDRGISAVEVVLLAPLMILFILVLFVLGNQVSARAAVDGAARDAARAGSLARDQATGRAQAAAVLADQLKDVCSSWSGPFLGGTDFSEGGLFVVRVECEVQGMHLVGLPTVNRVSGTSVAPIDPYRRVG